MAQLVGLLKDRGYEVKTLSLLESRGVPSDAKLVIIPNPRKDLLPDEVGYIRNYLKRGGQLIIALDIVRDAVPNLLKLVEYAGLRYDDGYIISKESSQVGQLITVVLPNYRLPGFENLENLYLIFPLSRRISTTFLNSRELAKLNMNVVPVLYAHGVYKSRKELLEESSKGQITFDESKVGDHVVAVRISMRMGEKKEKGKEKEGEKTKGSTSTSSKEGNKRSYKEWNIYLIADGEFLSDAYINVAANSDFMLSLVDNLVGAGKGWTMHPKKAKLPNTLTVKQIGALSLLTLGMPFVILFLGIALIITRRGRAAKNIAEGR